MQATSLRRKKGSIYTPPQRNMTVWDLPGRIIRPSPGYSGFPGPKKWLRTSRRDPQYRGRIFGPDNQPPEARIIRPCYREPRLKVLSRFLKIGPDNPPPWPDNPPR